jgi:hypothetical protein
LKPIALGIMLALLATSTFAFPPKVQSAGTKGTVCSMNDGSLAVLTPNSSLIEKATYNLMDDVTAIPHGDWKHYHDYGEISDMLLYMNQTYPNIVDVFPIGKSYQNRDIYCVRLTNESSTDRKRELFFVGCHHARERISAELPLYFIVTVVTGFGTNETLTRILNQTEIYIVPVLNVDGLEAVKNNEWQRKNAHPIDEDGDGRIDEDPPSDVDGDGYVQDLFFDNGTYYEFIRWEGNDTDADGQSDWLGGVDLNRNYGYQWNATCNSGSPDSAAEDYRGSAPFSELETQAIRSLVTSHNFSYAISFHSGAELVLYPWGYTPTPTPEDNVFREIAGNLSTLVDAPCEQAAELYTTSGEWGDWMYSNGSILALTCEIYQNYTAWQYKPGPSPDTWWESGITQAFNPNETEIETVIQRWLPVFTYTADRAISEHDVAVLNITPAKTAVGQGFATVINVTVANRGLSTETFNVTLYANSRSVATRVLTLAGTQAIDVGFTLNTTGFAYGSYELQAYASPVVNEARTLDNTCVNNQMTVTIPGDLDRNLAVTLSDLVILAEAYGSKPSDPRWNPNADIDGNGTVGLSDLVILAQHYGQHYP